MPRPQRTGLLPNDLAEESALVVEVVTVPFDFQTIEPIPLQSSNCGFAPKRSRFAVIFVGILPVDMPPLLVALIQSLRQFGDKIHQLGRVEFGGRSLTQFSPVLGAIPLHWRPPE